jgi:hypothetical protein
MLPPSAELVNRPKNGNSMRTIGNVRKAKQKGRKPRRGLRANPTEARITGAVRDMLNECGKISLSELDCSKIELIVREYSENFQLLQALQIDIATKKRLKNLSKHINRLLIDLGRIDFEDIVWKPYLTVDAKTSYFVSGVFRGAHVAHGPWIKQLTRLQTLIEDMISEFSRSRGGRSHLLGYFLPFLGDLLPIYVNAGSTSIRVSGGSGRKCPFIDFAFEVLQMIPRNHRPPGGRTKDALMAWWERHAREFLPQAPIRKTQKPRPICKTQKHL